jgi:HlyD family secretion protein
LKKPLIIGLVVVVFAAIIASILLKKDRGEATVEVGTVISKSLTAQVNCSGTIQPKRKVDVSANAMGTIIHLAVVEGQEVNQGDLLMEIDPSEYASAVDALQAAISASRADLKLAEASLDKAVADRDRAEKLHANGISSDEDLTAARTNARIEEARVQSAHFRIIQYEANLNKAHHDLTKVTITAPMAGVITRLNVEEGENAIMGTLNNPGTVLLVIADLGTMEAWVEVDETEVVKLALGQSASIKIDAFPNQEFSGVVTEVGNSPVRARSGSSREAVDFEVKITLERTLPAIRPGLSTKAEIVVAQRDDVLAVPLGAVTVRDYPLLQKDIRSYTGKRSKKQVAALADYSFDPRPATNDSSDIAAVETEGVFVVHDSFVKFVPVKLGIVGEDDFEILSGLSAGQKVVTGPFRILRELKDGAQIDEESDSHRGDEDKDSSD